jgi:hypothetical protein
MNQDYRDRHDQYVLGIRRGQEDASEGKPFTLPPCSAHFEQGYRAGYEGTAGLEQK